MKPIRHFLLAILGLSLLASIHLHAGTFSIENIHVYKHEGELSSNKAGIKLINPAWGAHNPRVSIPQVEAQVRVDREAHSQNLVAKAYFFDGTGRLIKAFDAPSAAMRPVDASDSVGNNAMFGVWPAILPANSRQSIFFPLPPDLPADASMVIVFGNKNGAVAASLPDGQQDKLAYPEKELVARTLIMPDVTFDDSSMMAPLIEQVVKSDNPAYPAFTLLVHLPHGVTDPKEVKGVLATCIIANSVSEIRDKLNAIKPESDPDAYFAFAEAHKMAIIAWGARWVWSSYANFDELDKDQARTWDDNFQKLANAWDHGVQLLVDRHGIPDHDYLMYGFCAGGEWVHRLALHKPDRFLAVQMHISTSYDAPTPEASHIMWLLTTGELDNGCDRARRFYSAARELRYPIIFKAFMGLGHADIPAADRLGVRFFDYALEMKARRDAIIAADPNHRAQPVDLSGFYASPFYGDLMNQEMFAAQEKEMIPSGFLVPLPTRDIADAWK